MRCETSFFSLTLYKKHLQRYWPLWAVWLAGWILALPVNLWNRGTWYNRTELLRFAQDATDILQVSGVIIAIVAPVVAVAVFFHLFRSPAANFVGALPLRREGVFATALAAGFTMLVGPLVVVSGITLAVEWALNAVAVGPLLATLGGCVLQCFFWFSFATLCCVISGNAVASVCFYTIFNGVVIVMVWLVQNLLSAFLYGFDQLSDKVWEIAKWLTPIFHTSLSYGMLNQALWPTSRFEMLWIYAAVGFLMLLGALGLHHIRRSERSGDLIAFGPIRWLFRISVTLCGGLSLGMLLLVILFSGRGLEGQGAALAGCCAVAALVSWFAAEMLLQKSFKVFKGHWKGGLVAATCFVVAICAIDMDWIGFTTRVPQPGQVRSAEAYFYGDADPIAREGLVYDAETVKELIDLHQYLVDHQEETGGFYGQLEVEYDLGLTSLRRSYTVWRNHDTELNDHFNAAQAAGMPKFDIDRGTPVQGDLVFGFKNNGYREVSRDLTPQEIALLWTAVVEDVEAGRYRAEGKDYTDNGTIEFRWIRADGLATWDQFYVRSSTTSVNAVIQELDLENMEKVDNAEYIFTETVG